MFFQDIKFLYDGKSGILYLTKHNVSYVSNLTITIENEKDDPYIKHFQELHNSDLVQLRIMDAVGCEKFAEHAFNFADNLIKNKTDQRCWVEEVEVREHGGNSAIVQKNK